MTKPIILSIDDDPGVLSAISRDLRRQYGERYRVMRADSGATALETLRELKQRNDEVLSNLQAQMKINLIREYDPEVPLILARGGDLNQVWTNLIDNAIDALNGEGTIWVITRYENRFVMVEIADNGPGIPAEIQPHLFEPFFTTKGVGAGTGLGLDITYRLIQQHSGSIEVQSKPGHTRFIIRLPVGTKRDWRLNFFQSLNVSGGA